MESQQQDPRGNFLASLERDHESNCFPVTENTSSSNEVTFNAQKYIAQIIYGQLTRTFAHFGQFSGRRHFTEKK